MTTIYRIEHEYHGGIEIGRILMEWIEQQTGLPPGLPSPHKVVYYKSDFDHEPRIHDRILSWYVYAYSEKPQLLWYNDENDPTSGILEKDRSFDRISIYSYPLPATIPAEFVEWDTLWDERSDGCSNPYMEYTPEVVFANMARANQFPDSAAASQALKDLDELESKKTKVARFGTAPTMTE